MSYNPYQNNYSATPKLFVLGSMKLSAIDKAVLKDVCFPELLTQGQVLQKRVKKVYINGGYAPKSRVEASDIRYVVVPRTVAEAQIAKFTVSPNASAQEKQLMSEVLKPKPRSQYYIDGEFLAQEVKWLLKQFSAPAPTPNAFADAEDLEFEDVTEVKEIAKPKKAKGLSPTHKGKAKKMYIEESKDAGEIAEALGVDVAKVIDYLKKLDK